MKKTNRTYLLTIIFAILTALALTGCQSAAKSPTTILIVRHGEKETEADDSPLNQAGMQRAQNLARLAGDYGVQAIYSSQFKRNQDTARPLAEKLNLPITTLPADLNKPDDYGKALAKDVLDKHAGQTVVIVGHSNSILNTVEALTGRPAPAGEVLYGDLFIVTIPAGGSAGKVLKAQYGL